jgi:hypothetical protein
MWWNIHLNFYFYFHLCKILHQKMVVSNPCKCGTFTFVGPLICLSLRSIWCIKYFELMCSLKNNGFNSHYDNFQFTIDNMIAINVNLWLILNVYMIFKVIVLNHSA